MDIQSALKKGQSILIDNNIISAKLDSEILMSKAIQRDRGYIMLHLEEKLDKKISDYYNCLLYTSDAADDC